MATTHDAKSDHSKADHSKADEAPKKGDVAEDLRGLTAAVKGDLTKLAGPKADKAIAHWETLLESVGPGVKAIHAELGKLREHVTKSDPDGNAIGKLLSSLGAKTAKVGEDQGGVIGTALKSLSSALEHASTSLSGDGHPAKTTAAK